MLRFDTRSKKPKLYNILVLTLGAAALAAVLVRAGAPAALLSALAALYYLAVIALLLRAWVMQIQYNPYSYNTIYYLGFAVFISSVLITQVYLTGKILREPEVYRVHEIFHVLNGAVSTYLFVTFPFILLFSIALCVSNISLIRHEGRRFVNILGIILSFLLVGGALFFYFADMYYSGSRTEVMIHDLFIHTGEAVYLYFESMLVGIIAAGILVSRYEPDRDKDFVIVLGCGIRRDGTPTPLLKGRLDLALDFRRRQLEETGQDLVFVTSGGQGPDEVISESACMKQYLLDQGIPEERIIEEDQSADTFENMKFSKEKIWAADPEGKVAFSTTNYHVFRSGLCARRVKMRAVGMGARTRWYFWPNAAVREFVGLLTEHRLKQALIFSGLLLISAVLTVLNYTLLG